MLRYTERNWERGLPTTTPFDFRSIGHFKSDERVAIWELYNEPCNGKDGDDGKSSREGKSLDLVRAAFGWAHEVEGRTQPLTIASWNDEEALNALVTELSDIISFHCYPSPEKGFFDIAEHALSHGRPVICSEYMARGPECTFEEPAKSKLP